MKTFQPVSDSEHNSLNVHGSQAKAEFTMEEADLKRILEDFNQTEVLRDRGTVMSLFEKQVDRFSDRDGIVNDNECLSYRQVNEHSNRLAHFLANEKGIGKHELIGVVLERSMELVPALYAILKAGAAYVPIDPTYPTERINTILQEARVSKVVSMSGLFAGKDGIEAIYLDKEQGAINGHSIANLPVVVQPEDTAYVLFTSGSTGKPKGVEVSHGSLYNIILHLQSVYPVLEKDCYLLKTNYSFDVSAAEIYGWFAGGGRLALLPKGAEVDAQVLLQTISRFDVTHLNFVPYVFSLFTESLSCHESVETLLSEVKYIFLAGEELPASFVKRFYSLCQHIQLENIYGPTEGTIYSSSYTIDRNHNYVKVPIGKPLSNISLYVLDQSMNPVPVGAVGELCISGANLAKGYLYRPDLTDEKFVSHPFRSGEKIYKTGDLAKWDENGNVVFLGRIDSEVKIRGVRINLEEIRSVLIEIPTVLDAYVLVRKDSENESYIYAYITGDKADQHSIRDILADKMPSYMVPASIQILDKFPLLPSGKVDKKSLPESRPASDNIISASNEVEKVLISYATQTFKVPEDKISVTDSILEYGRHSIKLMSFINLIEKHFNITLPIQIVFRKQTFQRLADYLIITTSTLNTEEGEDLIEICI